MEGISSNKKILSGSQVFSELIDNKNRDLWDYLRKQYDFQLEESFEEGFLTYFKGDTVIIEVDLDQISSAAFTHELLHVYMKSQGVKIVWDMKDRIESDPDLRDVFSTSLRVHIGNCLEHVKMFPLFLDRGYHREDFLIDYYKRIMEELEVKRLGDNLYIQGKIVQRTVDDYIGKYFAMKASVNPSFDYSQVLMEFQAIDPFLFQILDGFWQNWLKYQVGDPQEEYLNYLDSFLKNMKYWWRDNKKGPS